MCCFREVGELVVSVIQARDLEESDVTGTLDSYVKLWITPSRLPKAQTKVCDYFLNALSIDTHHPNVVICVALTQNLF